MQRLATGNYRKKTAFKIVRELLTEEQVAKQVGFSARTLRNWRIKGVGPHWMRIGLRRVYYRPMDVDRWLKRQLGRRKA